MVLHRPSEADTRNRKLEIHLDGNGVYRPIGSELPTTRFSGHPEHQRQDRSTDCAAVGPEPVDRSRKAGAAGARHFRDTMGDCTRVAGPAR